MPIEIEVYAVPDFQAPVNFKVEGLGQEHAGTYFYIVKWHCEIGRFSK